MTRKFTAYTLCSLMVLYSLSAFSQLSYPVLADSVGYLDLSMEQISVKEGLSQGMAYNIAMDHDGFLWVATKDGLNRFDGSNVKVYRNEVGNPNSISESHVTDVMVDASNRMWVSTFKTGVNYYDREHDRFIHINVNVGENNIIQTRSIGSLTSDFQGRVWLQTADTERFLVLEPSGKGNIRNAGEVKVWKATDLYPSIRHLPDSVDVEGYASMRSVKFRHDGSFLIFEGQCIYFFSKSTLKTGSPPVIISLPRDDMYLTPVTRWFEDKPGGKLYVIQDYRTLLIWDDVNKMLKPFLILPDKYRFHKSIMVDRLGDIWMRQPNGNLLHIHLSTGEFEVVRFPEDNYSAEQLSYWHMCFDDPHGNIWIRSSGHGVFKIATSKGRFRKLWPLYPEKDLLFMRFAIKGDSRWMDQEIRRKFLNGFNNTYLLNNDLETQDFGNSVAYDGKNTIYHYVIRETTMISCLMATNLLSGSHRILQEKAAGVYYPLFLDKSGNLWYGDYDGYGKLMICMMDLKTDKTIPYYFPTNFRKSDVMFITDFYDQGNGVIWVSTMDGLYKLLPENTQLKKISATIEGIASQTCNQFLSICPDPVKPLESLWIGTEGCGLLKFEIVSHAFAPLESEDELPNNVVYSVVNDKRGNLWLSTNNGISHLDLNKKSLKNYTSTDGLPGNEFNRFEYSKDSKGRIYFGGVDGVVYFDPEPFYYSATESKIVINGFKVFNKTVQYKFKYPRKGDFQLPEPIEVCKELVLNYDQKMITLSYVLLDLTSPSGNQYKYKLEGFDNNWIDAGVGNEAIYTNLNPGLYTFKVIGKSTGKEWSSNPATLKIKVLPPWWATWWFRTLVILAVLSLLYWFYRYRLARLMEVERVRNRIARDLHDEIGSTLSSISLFGAVMLKTSDDLSVSNISRLDKIVQSTSQMIEKMNDIVWSVRTDNDSFEHIINRLRAFAVSLTESKGIELEFISELASEKMKMKMELRKNVYLICKEAIINSIKYSGTNKILVKFEKVDNRFRVLIEDQGDGFDQINAVQGKMGGNGLKNMAKRASEMGADLKIDSQPGQGTRVELTLKL